MICVRLEYLPRGCARRVSARDLASCIASTPSLQLVMRSGALLGQQPGGVFPTWAGKRQLSNITVTIIHHLLGYSSLSHSCDITGFLAAHNGLHTLLPDLCYLPPLHKYAHSLLMLHQITNAYSPLLDA